MIKTTRILILPILILLFATQTVAVDIGMAGAVRRKTRELDTKVLDHKNATVGNTPVVVNSPVTIDEKVEALLAKMTLDEKIGQMTHPDSASLKGREEDIKTYFIGAILSGGNSDTSDNSPVSWADQYNLYQTYATQTRLAIPIIYGIDAVHGHNNVYGAVVFPHNIGLGCTNNETLVEQAAQVTAEEMTGTGINWAYAPCIAVARDERWGRTYESFGETPELVKKLGVAHIKGLQGTDLSQKPNVVACAKHYMGDGGTNQGIDQGDTVLDETSLRAIHLAGYVDAIAAGVKTIMVSYSSWNGIKMHRSQYLLTDVLKNELGFKGFVVSDWDAINQLTGPLSNQIATSINAGVDMVMMSGNYASFINTLRDLVEQGTVSQSRIDDAVRRILKVKYELGLFDNPFEDRNYLSGIGSSAHRDIARQCVRESLVLLKNNNNTLPLAKNINKIIVAGKNADDIGNQCGGWTISWQGDGGAITTGTTILQGIKNIVSTGTTVTYSVDGTGAAGSGADVGIVVIGERPYAEGTGDSETLALDTVDLTAVNNVKNAGIPVIVILVSGRPMILDTVLANASAFVAAWLPGTEGQGVAEVLFGDYNFKGKLSFSWPRSVDQLPLNSGDADYDPLFSYGYGLTYP
ncbi:MAG: glycoside hydrolase family 3 protein [bacterium]|nr:glycoside hydrolase family 3 protein [bacterium]